MVCPKCGSKEFESVIVKGFQKKCKKCGYIGSQMSDFNQ